MTRDVRVEVESDDVKRSEDRSELKRDRKKTGMGI